MQQLCGSHGPASGRRHRIQCVFACPLLHDSAFINRSLHAIVATTVILNINISFVLSCYSHVSAKAGIEFALEGGSLLGAIREGTMLLHEYDNDITIRAADLEKLRGLRQVFRDRYECVVVR